jgi:hypothetical protein
LTTLPPFSENPPAIIQELTRVVKKDNFLKTIISIGVNKDLGWSKRWSKSGQKMGNKKLLN